MSKKTRKELEVIKNFVDRAYNRWGNVLIVSDKPYDPLHTELGLCFKHKDPGSSRIIYKIECGSIGIERTDFRIKMHEYGHIYLAHLDGIHEELDVQICNLIKNNRGQLIQDLNRNLGITDADKLIERIIDDPILNHSLHNIAMDMEVNSTVLSLEDVDEMEKDIDSLFPKTDQEALEYLSKHSIDPKLRNKVNERLEKMKAEARVKLIYPTRYYLGPKLDSAGNPILDADGKEVLEPFPEGLSYAEYLMLIIEHLDQFVKMMASIQMGGNGDTSQITQQMIQQMIQQMKQQKASDDYKKGFQDGKKDYQDGKIGRKENQPESEKNQDPNQQGKQQDQQQQQKQQQGQSGQGQDSQDGQDGQGQGQDPSNQGQDGQSGQGQDGQGQGQGQPGDGQPGSSQGGQPGDGQGQPSAGDGTGGSGQSQMSDYEQGYQDALQQATGQNGQGGQGQGQSISQSLSDMMDATGMSDHSNDQPGENDGNTNSPYDGERNLPDADSGRDHRTDSRDEADQKREVGQIYSRSTIGCGSSGGPDVKREVDAHADEVDMALTEVLRNMRSRVVKFDTRKDNLKLYNRGVIRDVIAPTVSRKVTISNEPKPVFLIDISGSMDTALIDRCLNTISKSLKKMSRGLRYDIITWSTCLGEHIKNIDPKKGVPRISSGGGTSIAGGIQYFKDNYGPECILIIISDFEDYLQEWSRVESTMSGYTMYGFNYGSNSYHDSDKISWKYLKVRKFRPYR